MNPNEIDRAYEVALRAAAETSALLLEGFRNVSEVRHKGTIDLVTEFDLRSEALVRDILVDAFPGHRIVGEEGGTIEPQEASGDLGTGVPTWFVDPLDGTTNFSHGHPIFAVSIGLHVGKTGLVGVVAAPALGITWSAARGRGCYRTSPQGRSDCRVSKTTELGKALGATGFPYDKWTNPDHNLAEFDALLTKTQGIRRCGAAAIDLALTADGTYDFYWEDRLSAWDLAAGVVLVEEAGGRVTDYHGSRAAIEAGALIASNGHLHPRVQSVLAETRSAPRA